MSLMSYRRRVDAIASQILAGERLGFEEAVDLYRHAPLGFLGELADSMNVAKNDGNTFYNINRHINPTNVCVKTVNFARIHANRVKKAPTSIRLMKSLDERAKLFLKAPPKYTWWVAYIPDGTSITTAICCAPCATPALSYTLKLSPRSRLTGLRQKQEKRLLPLLRR